LIFDPHRIDHRKICTGDYVGDPYPIPNLVQIRPRGGRLVGK